MINTDEIKDFFDGKVQEFGATPEGLGWSNEDAQKIRFEQIILVVQQKKDFSINHLGCGYGSLYHKLLENNYSDFNYRGYDISPEMIKTAKKENASTKNCKFTLINESDEMLLSDYTVCSGIFNVKMNFSNDEWLTYIINILHEMNKKSVNGFAFNMLTSYSDKHLMRDDLYYGDPCFFFDYCKKHFSKNVKLLHDYELYDFTIVVKK